MHMSDKRPLNPKFDGQFTYIKQLRVGEEQKHVKQIFRWQPAPFTSWKTAAK